MSKAIDPPRPAPPEIRSEGEYVAVKVTLSRQNRPVRLLRVLMNAFESYRQARKIGWSRPWNKIGMRTFLSFRLDIERDREIIGRAVMVLQEEASQAPPAAQAFVGELMHSPNLMAFIFFSEYEENGERFETMTLSLGRCSPTSPRHRDRIDLVFDAAIKHEQNQGLTRLRLYIDPYNATKEPLWAANVAHPLRECSHRTFVGLAQLCRQHHDDSTYVWNHWTSAYIDYFGARQWRIANSIFGPTISGANNLRYEQVA